MLASKGQLWRLKEPIPCLQMVEKIEQPWTGRYCATSHGGLIRPGTYLWAGSCSLFPGSADACSIDAKHTWWSSLTAEMAVRGASVSYDALEHGRPGGVGCVWLGLDRLWERGPSCPPSQSLFPWALGGCMSPAPSTFFSVLLQRFSVVPTGLLFWNVFYFLIILG